MRLAVSKTLEIENLSIQYFYILKDYVIILLSFNLNHRTHFTVVNLSLTPHTHTWIPETSYFCNTFDCLVLWK